MRPQTLIIGQQTVYVPSCGSTNEVAQLLFLKNNATEGALVYTDNQTAGRGQRGSIWEAAPGQNLTLSVLLKPAFLALREQFLLTICCSLALTDLLQPYTQEQIRVKWPNDIYAGNKKIAGMLIENSTSGHTVQQSIVGIGLNVNQRQFAAPQATSLRLLTGRAHPLPELLAELCQFLEKRYLQLRAGQYQQLRAEYLQQLYRFGQWHPYRANGQELNGCITGITDTGMLDLQTERGLLRFSLKEIEFCF